jgi:N-acetylmuramic acid 6-phosphate etherase
MLFNKHIKYDNIKSSEVSQNMVNISNLKTEVRNEKTMNLDLLSVKEIIEIMNDEDINVIETIKKSLPEIEKLINTTIEVIADGGRIIYIGAGTSGRMGLMDAVECRPTFNCDDEFIGLIAGGEKAFIRAAEGAEDSKEMAVADLKNINLSSKDIVIGIAASGRTPYVIGGLEYAREVGAKTGSVCCNYGTEISKYSQNPVEVNAGSEVLTGSTRLKAGTCQKIILNMISTATMIKSGKVYGNLMVDVQATNEKLVERCKRIVMEATGVNRETASEALSKCDNNCKVAIVMILLGIDEKEATKKLEVSKGFIRKVI